MEQGHSQFSLKMACYVLFVRCELFVCNLCAYGKGECFLYDFCYLFDYWEDVCMQGKQ